MFKSCRNCIFERKELMGFEKEVKKCPGIGKEYGKKKLEDAGFYKACEVLGQFFVLERDEKEFCK